jgi:hypothetical protein
MALRLLPNISADDRFAEWTRVCERAYAEQINQGWRHRMFRLLRAVFNKNAALAADGGYIVNWAAAMYLDAALMCIRREIDSQAGAENLRNLLDDIAQTPTVLTRARHVAQWPRDDQDMAHGAFDSFNPIRIAGDPATDHIDPAIVRADLDSLVEDVERLRTFAERTRAHRSPPQGIDPTITFRDVHPAIRDIRQVLAKYYEILTSKPIIVWEPSPPFDPIAAFTTPSFVDRDAVALAAEEDRKAEPTERSPPETAQ